MSPFVPSVAFAHCGPPLWSVSLSLLSDSLSTPHRLTHSFPLALLHGFTLLPVAVLPVQIRKHNFGEDKWLVVSFGGHSLLHTPSPSFPLNSPIDLDFLVALFSLPFIMHFSLSLPHFV